MMRRGMTAGPARNGSRRFVLTCLICQCFCSLVSGPVAALDEGAAALHPAAPPRASDPAARGERPPSMPPRTNALLAAAAIATVSCGHGGTTSRDYLAVDPPVAVVAIREQVQFQALAAGAPVGAAWSIEEGTDCGVVTPDGLYTAPDLAAASCHVVASSTSGTAAATVTVLPVSSSGAPARQMGIGVNGGDDWMGDKLYANAFRIGHAISGSVDSNGWPTSTSFQATVFESTVASDMAGTWGVRFKGRVSGVSGATLTPKGGSWAAAFDGTYTTATMTGVGSALTLIFSGAYRDSSTANPGITDLRVMYPTSPGATTYHDWNETTHRVTRALLRSFSAIRFMDFLQISAEGPGNLLANWADRLSPLYAHWGALQRTYPGASGPSYIGGPMEDMILMCNEIGVDCYLNIPSHATDDFVTKTAQLFAYGSDGVNPYTSPQSNPVYPPLKAGLNLYIEYSNEIWNTLPAYASQHAYVDAQAAALNSASPGLLQFDGQTDNLAARWWTYRTVQISNIFRSVFGDAAMMTRIRPLLESQFTNSYTTWGQVTFLLGFFNNMQGTFVGPGGSFASLPRWNGTGGASPGPAIDGPHPPSYYLYGGGGSGYYSPANESAALPGFFTDGDMNPTTWSGGNQQERHQLAAAGLKRVAYEGGPGFDAQTTQELAAFKDPAMITSFVAHQQAWDAFDGDLLCYYEFAEGYQWGFLLPDATHPSGNAFGSMSNKLAAVVQLGGAPAAAIDFGAYHATALPGSRAGAAKGTSDSDYNSSSSTGAATINANHWVSYTFYNDVAASGLVVNVTLSAGTGSISVYFDGQALGSQTAAAGTLSFPLPKAPRGIHGVAVRALPASSLTVTSVQIQ
jgi:hypothetical protein